MEWSVFGERTFSHTSDKSEEECNLFGQLFDSLLSMCVCLCIAISGKTCICLLIFFAQLF